jgi:hypothetical protein
MNFPPPAPPPPPRYPAAPPLHTTSPAFTPPRYLLLHIILISVKIVVGCRRLAANRIIPAILRITNRSSSSSPGVYKTPPLPPETPLLRLMVESRQSQQASLPVFLSQPVTVCVYVCVCSLRHGTSMCVYSQTRSGTVCVCAGVHVLVPTRRAHQTLRTRCEQRFLCRHIIVCVGGWVGACVRAWVRAWVRACVHTYSCIHTPLMHTNLTYTYTYTHTHTHTHTLTCNISWTSWGDISLARRIRCTLYTSDPR